MKRTLGTLMISLLLLALYILSMFLGEAKTVAGGSSGTWHEWIGLLTGFVVVVHGVLYWKQILATLRSFFRSRQKLFVLLNLLVLVTVTLTVISGIITSEPLGFGQMHSEWNHLHHVITKVSLLLILLHALFRLKKIKSVLFGAKS